MGLNRKQMLLWCHSKSGVNRVADRRMSITPGSRVKLRAYELSVTPQQQKKANRMNKSPSPSFYSGNSLKLLDSGFFSVFSHIKYLSKLQSHRSLFFHPHFSTLLISFPFLRHTAARELHTIPASVRCCPGNRITKNRSIFFLLLTFPAHNPTVFQWHRAFSHLFFFLFFL